MRSVRALLCASFLVVPSMAFADLASEDMVRVIAKLDLERSRSEAHARCVSDVPGSIQWLKDPVVEQYCVLRHGAPRKVGLFVGVRLSAELDQAGKTAQSAMIDALLDVQEADLAERR